MAQPLWQKGVIYPSDEVGEYVELEGTIVEIDDPMGDTVAMKVSVPGRGVWTVFDYLTHYMPKVGYDATIRTYRWGGGWYPDDRLMSWRSHPCAERKAEQVMWAKGKR